MDITKIGGPAFPIKLEDGSSYKHHSMKDGMTLLDYFAAEALPEIMKQLLHRYQSNSGIISEDSHRIAAAYSYKIASAMIEERKKYFDS